MITPQWERSVCSTSVSTSFTNYHFISTMHNSGDNSQDYQLKCQYGYGTTIVSETHSIHIISTPLPSPRVYHTALHHDITKYIYRWKGFRKGFTSKIRCNINRNSYKFVLISSLLSFSNLDIGFLKFWENAC